MEYLFICAGILFSSPGILAVGFLSQSSHDLEGLGFDVSPPFEVPALAGSSINIPCSSRTPSASISWVRNNAELTSNHQVLKNGTLHITKISEKAVYRCLVSAKGYTLSSAPTHVWIVDEKTLWDAILPQKITASKDSILRLECSPRSWTSLKPQRMEIKWKKDNQYISQNSRIFIPSPGILHVMNVKLEDSGVYRCEAVLNHIEKSVLGPPTEVVVQKYPSKDPPNESEEKVILRKAKGLHYLTVPSVVKTVLGSSALLECISNDQRPNPHVWKTFDGKEIRPGHARMVAQGSLFFPSVQIEDSDVYKCVSSYSGPGKDEISLSLVRLVVQRPPVVNMTPSMMVVNGFHPNINCTVEGLTESSVEMFKDGALIKNSYNKRIYKHKGKLRNTYQYRLVMHYVWSKDEGLYQCISWNSAGASSDIAELRIKDVATIPPPQNVVVTKVTSSSLAFKWDKLPRFGSGSQKEGYIVRFSSNGQKPIEKVLSSSDLSIEFTDLTPDTNHTFIIHSYIALNTAMNISDPFYVYQMTKVERPTQGPDINFFVKDDNIHLFWKPRSLVENGGHIVSQSLQWTVGDAQYKTEQKLAPNVTKFILTDVDTSLVYKVRVLPRTIAGGPLDTKWHKLDFSGNTTYGRGDSKSRFDINLCLTSNGPSTILMKWNQFPELDQEIYTINLTLNNGGSKIVTAPASQKQLLLRKLEPGCYVTVVENKRFDFNLVKTSSSICTVIPPTLSAHPSYKLKSSQVTKCTNDTIQIKWVPSTDVLFFLVEISQIRYKHTNVTNGGRFKSSVIWDKFPEGDLNADDCYVEDPTTCLYRSKQAVYKTLDSYVLVVNCLFASLTELLPATTYRIRVSAADFNVYGVPSTPLFVTTLDGLPSAPRHFASVPLTTSTVNITWAHPETLNGRLTKYEIAFSADKNNWKLVTIPHHTTSYVLKGLISNTMYYLKIVASTSSGRGTALDAVVCIPAELKQGLSPEMIGLCVISVFVVIACAILVYLCVRMYRMRQGATLARQVNYAPQIVYLNEDQVIPNQSDPLASNHHSRNNTVPPVAKQQNQSNKNYRGVQSHPDEDCALTELLPHRSETDPSSQEPEMCSSL